MSRTRKAKLRELKAEWGTPARGQPSCLVYSWGPGVDNVDYNMLHYFLHVVAPGEGRSFVDWLREHGYDLATLKFSIHKVADK